MSNSPLRINVERRGWNVAKLASLLILLKDGTHGTHERVDQGIPLLSAKDITAEGGISLNDGASLISLDDHDEIHKNYSIDLGDILLTVVGTLGRCAICSIEEKFSIQRSVAVLRVDRDVTNENYLYYFMLSDWFQNQLHLRSNATAQAGVYLGELGDIEIAYPACHQQQQKIAKILTTVDNLIEKTQSLIDKYTAIKQGMMADLFTRGIDLSGTPDTNPNHGQLRPPVEQAPELYKQTELGWVPKEWEVRTFAEIADYKNGSSFSTDDWKEEGLPIIRIQNLNGSDEYNYYQGEVQENWHVLPGDLLFAWSGQKGVSFGARTWGGAEGVLNQHIFKVYENGKLLSRKFLYYLFKINVGRIENNAHGFKDSFVHVTRSELTDVAIMLPPPVEQKIIEDRVTALESSISIEERSLDKYGKFKKGLMQDLLTGTVRVN